MSTFNEIAKKWVGGLMMYQPGKPIEEVARELGLGDPETIIKLASNENALGPSPKAVAAMRDAAAGMHIYPDGDNYRLRHALAGRLGVSPDELFLGNGSNEIIQLLGHVFLDRSTRMVVSDHAFVIYRLVAALYEAGVISTPARNLGHDLQAMAAAITADTRLVYISNPNNPTGTMVTPTEIAAFMRDVPGHVVVVFDEAYIELLPEEQRPDTIGLVRENRNVVILRTFSKVYGLAGLRLGYAIAPRECVSLLHRVRQPFNVNAMAQAAALAALDDDAFVEQSRAMVAKGLQQLTAAFDRLGLDYVPSSANFILVKIGQGKAMFEALQRRRVITRPVDAYQLPDYLRVTVGTPAENAKFIAALEDALAERGRGA